MPSHGAPVYGGRAEMTLPGAGMSGRDAHPFGWLLFLEQERIPLALYEGRTVIGRVRKVCEDWGLKNGLGEFRVIDLPNDDSVSSLHLFVETSADALVLKDLKSTNKTFIGSTELIPNRPYPVQDRARVLLARIEMMFVKYPAPKPGGDTVAISLPARPVAAAPTPSAVSAPVPPGQENAVAELQRRLAEAEQRAAAFREQLLDADRIARELERKVARLFNASGRV